MISIYPSSRDNVKAVNYLPVKCDTFKDISRYALASMWSPILFKDNYRKKINFISSEWCVLDIDGGVTLIECCKILQRHRIKSVVLSTENHQKLKNEKICDRMRVVMRWDRIIADVNVYEFNYGLWNNLFKGDKSTAEGARHFKASGRLLAAFDGDLLAVKPVVKKNDFNKWKELEKLDYLEKKTLPPMVKDFVEYGILPGSGRQDSFFKAACSLRAIGVEESEARKILRSAPININNFDFEREFNHAVSSAYRYT